VVMDFGPKLRDVWYLLCYVLSILAGTVVQFIDRFIVF